MKSKLLVNLIIGFVLSMIAILTGTQEVKALYYATSYYDSISWIYSYEATYTSSYNCLGWATGSMTWEWPSSWGEQATNAAVTNYLTLKGYTKSNLAPSKSSKIIAYGPGYNKITHFSKVTTTKVTAKWGQLERFSHLLTFDPYYESGPYGLVRANYY